ncbi:MAG: hypothetical protein P9L93_04220 [Candidatus Gorgyraea atricola]|nr:hypothetical protein [Candidatus Gorgyraea atricola]
MDKTLRSILWVLVALVVLSSFSTGWFFVAKERLYTDYLDLESLFKTSVDKLNREIVSSTRENQELKSKLDAIQGELETVESRAKDLKFQYDKILGDRDDLNKELVRVKKGKFYLEKKVREMESDIFVAGLLREKASLEVALKGLKESTLPKDLEIEQLRAENMDFEIKLTRVEEEKELLEKRFKDATEVAEILSKDLLKEKHKNEETKQYFEDMNVESRVLKSRISELEEASGSFDRLLAEKDDMRSKIARLERKLENKNREIAKVKERTTAGEWRAEAYHAPSEVDLPPIVLDSPGYGSSASSLGRITEEASLEGRLRGRVVTVNRDHNFVVIDIGKQDGVDVGTIFNVYRGDSFVGSTEVIQTRERISACDIKNIEEGFFIEVDDLIIK